MHESMEEGIQQKLETGMQCAQQPQFPFAPVDISREGREI